MLTPRQKEIFNYIERFAASQGYSPTIAEIMAHFGLSSPASVHQLLTGLEKEGLIRRIPHARRGIEVVEREVPAEENEIPLLGVVAAGMPIEAILTREVLRVPPDMLRQKGAKGRPFALKVKGDSMIGDHILDGDLIIVESRQTAENGQTVVALIDGSEATVKRFYRSPGGVRLEPANPDYETIVVEPADRLAIQGIVIGVIRKYIT